LRMQALDIGETGKWRLFAFQQIERRRFQRARDGAQAIRPLWVAMAGVVIEAG